MENPKLLEKPVENKNRTKPYSISLTPNEVEKIKLLGYNLTDVTRIGIQTVLFRKKIIISQIPYIIVEFGMGLILLSLSVLVLSNFYLSYILFFTSFTFIAISVYVLISSLFFSRNIKRMKK